mmetsp:Transcript_118956/g.253746  ORF Transcript_118956/g.253746 Transcript_118956/m.253746 type:complete len:208 (+) Transcript_118956:82-705(+)
MKPCAMVTCALGSTFMTVGVAIFVWMIVSPNFLEPMVNTSIDVVDQFSVEDKHFFELTVIDSDSAARDYEFFIRASDDCPAVARAVAIMEPSGELLQLRSVCDSDVQLPKHDPPLQLVGRIAISSPGVYRVTSVSGMWERVHLDTFSKAIGVGILAFLGVYGAVFIACLLVIIGAVLSCLSVCCQCLDKREQLLGDNSDADMEDYQN